METLAPLPAAPSIPDEDTAFAAMRELDVLNVSDGAYKSLDPDVIAAASTTTPAMLESIRTKAPELRRTLDGYLSNRRARNLTVFPTKHAQANKSRNDFFNKLYSGGIGNLSANLPADQFKQIEAAAAAAKDEGSDPDEIRARTINYSLISTAFGKEIPSTDYTAHRDHYAKQLGIQGTVTDKILFDTLKTRYTEEDTAATSTRAFAGQHFQSIIEGKGLDLKAVDAHLATIPPRLHTGARQSIAEARREALDARRRLMPIVEQVRGTVELLQEYGKKYAKPRDTAGMLDPIRSTASAIRDISDSRETMLRFLIVDMAENLPDNRLERDLSLAMLSGELAKLPPEDRPATIRFIEGLERGLNTISEGQKSLGYATIRETLADIPAAKGSLLDRAKDDIAAQTELRTKVAQLKSVIQGGTFDLKAATDNIVKQSLIAFAPSVPYTVLAVTPYGFPAMAASMAGQSIQDAAIQYPDGNTRAQYTAGLTSGVAQAAAETIFTQVGLKLAAGRIPTLTNLLNRAGVSSIPARVAIGAPLAAGAATATEYTEEVIQGGTDKALQGLAAEFSGIAPDYQWGKFFTDWIPGNSPESRETLKAIVPFAMLAGGVASVQHIRNGRYYLRHAAIHEALGLTPDESKAVFSATTDEAAQQALQSGFQAAQQRAATLTPEQEADLAAKRANALQIIKRQAELRAAAGMPVVETETNEFTGADQYYFTNPETKERQEFDTEDQALQAFADWHASLPFDSLSRVETAARPDWISSLTAEGQANEETKVDDTNQPMNLGVDMTAAEADLKAAEKAALTGTTPAARRDAESRAESAKKRIDRIKARFEMFIMDKGLQPGSVKLSDLVLRAHSFSTSIGNRIIGWTVQLFQGSTIQDITEDMAETMLKRGIADNLLSPYQIQEDIRAYERATGRQILPTGYDYTPENSLPLVEGFSKLARGFVFANARHADMPPTVREWVEMATAVAAATVDVTNSTAGEFMADLSTAADLRAAIAAGTVPQRLQNRLADSIGLNPAETEARLRARMEAQLAAEAMEGFPEISQVMKGRLPHPVTMTDKGLPFAGEIRRLWDTLVKPTRRRTKTGREIDRTNEANAYFLPIGQVEDLDQLRRTVNQEGFSFDTPAEMIEALELSLAYGKPQYGTASADFGQSTYALSLPGLLTLDQTLTRLASQGPEERAAYYEKLRNRLASLTLIAREAKRNTLPDQTEAEQVKTRIRDAIAEANAIRDALPPEARGRLKFSVTDLIDKDTERGTIAALVRLVADADDALETVLIKEYREAFEKLLDLAKPDLRPNKQLRGRLTPATQQLVGKILDIVSLDSDAHRARVLEVEGLITTLNNEIPATPERATEIADRIFELSEELDLLTTFGPFAKLEAAELSIALRNLEDIYTTGRTQRRMLDENKRAEMEAARREVVASNPAVNHTRHAKGKAKVNLFTNLILGLSSFHQVMEYFFPNSITARDYQARIRAADRAVTWDRINLRDRYDAFTFSTWNLSGSSRRRKRNRIVYDLSQIREDWGITIKEGVTFEEVKLDEDQAAAILSGKIKTGWEMDMIAMQSLADALQDFRMMRLKAQAESKAFTNTVIRFRRLKARGAPSDFTASHLSAAYLLQLWAQPQYRPALDKYGFTEAIMAQIEAKLDPKAKDLIEFMRQEYDDEWERLNPVYRSIYNMDMPKIRNYAPGVFEHMDAKSGSDAGTITPEGGAPGVNAMSAGFTKTRQHHMAKPDDQNNALNQFFAHQESANYFVHYAEIVRDVRQVLRHPEVRRQLNGLHGQENTTQLFDWLDDIEIDGRRREKEVGFFRRLGNRYLAVKAMTGLAFNLGTLLKQASAGTGFLMEMPAKQAMAGLWQAITRPGEYRAAVATLWNNEAIRQRILQGISPEDRQVLQASANSPSALMDWLEAGRVPIGYTDAALTSLSGAVAYTYHRNAALAANQSPSVAEAAGLAAATRVIERTAQPATTQDKSSVELHPSFAFRMLTQFRSDQRQKFAISAHAILAATQGRMTITAAANRVFWSWGIYGLINAAMADLWLSISRDDDDPDKWTWQDYLACMIAGPLSGVPILGTAAVNAMQWAASSLGGKQKPFSSSALIEDGVERIPSAWRKSSKVFEELTDTDASNDPTVNEILTTMQQFAAGTASLTGSPMAALPAALLRLARDVQGVAANAIDWTTGTPDDDALAIVRQVADESKPTRDGTAEETKAIAAEILKLPADQRAKRLESLTPTRRAAVRRQLKRADMTASEAALDRLPAPDRAKAIERILSTTPESQRPITLDRYRSLGLTPDP